MMDLKLNLAKELEQKLGDNQVIGLGSGTTAEVAVRHLGQIINKQGLNVTGVPSSKKIAEVAEECGWLIKEADYVDTIDWTFDGADRVDSKLRLIKGGGGCLLNEKILAQMSKDYYILVTEDKLVESFSIDFPLPIEVTPKACKSIISKLKVLDNVESLEVRKGSNFYGNVITDSGNYILDCVFSSIDQNSLDKIISYAGVVEHGLFDIPKMELLVANRQTVEVKVR